MAAKKRKATAAAGGERRGVTRKTAERPAKDAPAASVPPVMCVVGIGASAGGFEAITAFLRAMPANSGLTFVILQHSDPSQKSLAAEIFSKRTAMRVTEAADSTRLEPNQVYVTPPGMLATMEKGLLRLAHMLEPRGRRLPIDHFFRSLGEDQKERAIGVILSGSGTDGTLGLRSIVAHGGIVVVQDPATAQFDGMPRSAIASDLVTHVLAVEKMPEALMSYARHPYAARPAAGKRALLDVEDRPASREPGSRRGAKLKETKLQRQLEDELRTTREALQHMIERLESSNEEMRLSNEELQSMNEELESSKEELQSLNEEFSTVNQQLHSKVAELETSNNDLKNVIESSKVATLCLDRELRIKWFTPAVRGLLNVILTDVGRPIADLRSPLAGDSLVADAARVLARLAPVETELHDSGDRWYVRRTLPYRTDDERINGVIITFSEVTSQKATERRLRENAEQLRLALAGGSLGVWTHDLATGEMSWDDQAHAILGLREGDERTEAAFFAAVHAEDRARVREARDRALEAGGEFSAEFRVKRPGGTLGWVLARARYRVGERGTAMRLAGVLMDRTERRQAYETLLESEAKLRAIIETASDAIISIDESGTITACNPSAERMFGFRREEMIGNNVNMLMAKPYLEEHDAYLERYHRTGQRRVIGVGREVMCRRKDGSEFPVELSVGESHVAGRRFYTGLLHDITGRKEAEQRMRSLNESLEARVRERTRQLQAMVAELTAAEERERRSIAQDLHDDLTQLLNVVILRLDTLRKSVAGAGDRQRPLAELRELVEQANTRVRSLSFQLCPPVLYELGLVPALQWLGDELQRVYGLRVDLTDDGAPKPVAQVPRAMLFRAARELLINIAKHAGVNHAVVESRLNGGHLSIAVRDEGTGFDAEQVLGAANRGLGLFSVQERLAAIGGRVDVASKAGAGTTITLVAPLELEMAAQAAGGAQ